MDIPLQWKSRVFQAISRTKKLKKTSLRIVLKCHLNLSKKIKKQMAKVLRIKEISSWV